MTKETTASQPKSIGDDAIEAAALKHVATSWGMLPVAAYRSGDYKQTEQFKRLKAFALELLDSRAPAAQASATIQAAPDDDMVDVTCHECHGIYDPRMICMACSNTGKVTVRRSAATIQAGKWVRCTPDLINAGVDCAHTPRRPGNGTYSHDHFIAHSTTTTQEPVMVADPDNAMDEANKLATLAAWFKEGKLPDNIYWKVGVTAEAMRRVFSIAAPMVADPAGVAVQDAAQDLMDVLDGYDEQLVPINRKSVTVTRLRSALAATVKAVPSEALEGCEHCLHTYCLSSEICRHCGDVNGTQGYKGGKLAAPLADKTGGGE